MMAEMPSEQSPARTAALSILLSAHNGEGPVDELLNDRFRDVAVDPRDRALAMELASGVLRRQETRDWRLRPVLKKPLHHLPIVIHMLLRMGAYQLLYLDRIPPSAAVDESVKMARACSHELGRDWTGFINGVLRNLLRLPEPPLPDRLRHPSAALSIAYAMPLWLCQRWVERLGVEQAETVCRTASAMPSVTLRVNRGRVTRDAVLLRLQAAGIAAMPTTISPVGVILEKGSSVTSLPGFDEGHFYVEDEAAQLIPPLLDARPGHTVLDACAAPGGKATHLAELMRNEGRIVAMDRHKDRLVRLQENCRRLSATVVMPVVGDARRPAEALPFGVVDSLDRVLVDAPCSGLGVLRRHPEAKQKKHTAMFARHHLLQCELLAAVAAVLRPGGVLVYSTCSTEPEETEEVIEQFCRLHQQWQRESVAPWLPPSALPFVTPRGALSTMINDCGMDGFYAVRMRKVS